MIIGLSLIATCFNLMQETLVQKFKKLAINLEIIKDPNESKPI